VPQAPTAAMGGHRACVETVKSNLRQYQTCDVRIVHDPVYDNGFDSIVALPRDELESCVNAEPSVHLVKQHPQGVIIPGPWGLATSHHICIICQQTLEFPT